MTYRHRLAWFAWGGIVLGLAGACGGGSAAERTAAAARRAATRRRGPDGGSAGSGGSRCRAAGRPAASSPATSMASSCGPSPIRKPASRACSDGQIWVVGGPDRAPTAGTSTCRTTVGMHDAGWPGSGCSTTTATRGPIWRQLQRRRHAAAPAPSATSRQRSRRRVSQPRDRHRHRRRVPRRANQPLRCRIREPHARCARSD